MTPLAIEVSEVGRWRRSSLTERINTLHNVSFTLEPGEIVGLLGPNGAGKSTMMRLITGLLRPHTGYVRLDGSAVSTKSLSRVGSLIEGPALYPWMSASITMSTLTHTSSETAARILERVGLTTSRPVRTYSQGMRQRLGIAVAIANGTSTVILDEPTNGLDPAGARDLEALVREIRDQGRAVLVSSHQLDAINRVCDRVVLLNMGRTVGHGTAAELGANRSWLRVRADGVEPSWLLKQARLKYSAEKDAQGNGILVDTQDSDSLVALVGSHGVDVHVDSVNMSLEDRFLMLTSAGL